MAEETNGDLLGLKKARREKMIAAATKFEADLRTAVSASQPDLTDKDYCHLLAMKCVQYEQEVMMLNGQIAQLRSLRTRGPNRIIRGR